MDDLTNHYRCPDCSTRAHPVMHPFGFKCEEAVEKVHVTALEFLAAQKIALAGFEYTKHIDVVDRQAATFRGMDEEGNFVYEVFGPYGETSLRFVDWSDVLVVNGHHGKNF